REPAPREHHGARLQRSRGDDGEVQGEHPHRLLHRRGRSCGGDAPAARDVCLMHYRIVAVGRVRDAALRAACDGYLERLRRYTRVEEREVKDQARILEGVPEGSRLVALSEGGEQWTSEQLADWTARWELDGRDVAFVILTERGALRGCIGHIAADRELGAVVREMAVAAARDDPRFAPVSREELPSLALEISVLSERTLLPAPVDAERVVVGRDGLI